MIYPHLLYGIVIWGSTFEPFPGKSSAVQNKVLKIIAGGNRLDNTTQHFVKLNILIFDDL